MENHNSYLSIAHILKEQCYRYQDMEVTFFLLFMQSFSVLADANKWLVKEYAGKVG